MNDIEKFETFLNNKLEYTNMMIKVLGGSLDFDNQDELDFLFKEKLLLNDIIYHFKLFVKGESDV